ncbi:MAG: Ig-like domain-containing protein, partial [Verrucomicrobiota bacterium]
MRSPFFISDPFSAPDAYELDDPDDIVIYEESILAQVIDADGDSLTFLKVDGPAWLTVDVTGLILGAPSAADVGTNFFTVMVLDGESGADYATMEIHVINVNDAPVFVMDPVDMSDATEGVAYSDTLAGMATDEDPTNDTMTYSKLSGPGWLTVAGDGTLGGVPGAGDLGITEFSIQVDDGNGGSDTATLRITVRSAAGTGTILRERFSAGGRYIADLLAGPNFPDNPFEVSQMPSLSQPSNIGDYYGTRFRGYVHPPTNGSYTFYIGGRDYEEMWFNPAGEDPTGAVLIASAANTGATDWDVDPTNQHSAAFTLTAGQKYYIEVLHIEHNSGDQLAGGWQGPGISRQIIDGTYLSPWIGDPSFVSDPFNVPGGLVDAPYVDSIADLASDPEGSPLTFIKIAGPDWLTVATDGTLSGTPTAGDVGTNTWTVRVSDGHGGTETAAMEIVIYDPPGGGTIMREWWSGIGGNDVADLTSDPDYPHNPTGTNEPTLFETPSNWDDDYGTRMVGYVHPLADGDYTFWMAADNKGELWLSTDQTLSNAVMIADVQDWTASREWDKYPQQQSLPVTLTGGEKYFIMALHKAGGGGDHLAVAWEGPGIAQTVIDGAYLTALHPPVFTTNRAPDAIEYA